MFRPRVPSPKHPYVRDLATKLGLQSDFARVRVAPIEGAAPNDCFEVVKRHVEVYGGSICYGWAFWEIPGCIVEAEFHAVWRSGHETLDLTPKTLNMSYILFAEDPGTPYTGRQISNVRVPLYESMEILEFIAAAEAKFEFLNSGDRAEEYGNLSLSLAEQTEWEALLKRQVQARVSLSKWHSKMSSEKWKPNEPCWCKSGSKYKKCCGAPTNPHE